jgi:beta-glucosidase
MFTPVLSENVTIPGTTDPGYKLHWYGEDPDANPAAEPIHSTTTTQAEMYFADSHPPGVPRVYWLRVTATYTAPKTTTITWASA